MKKIKFVIYEATLEWESYLNLPIITDLSKFKDECDIIVSNRLYNELIDIKEKVFTRDLYNRE